MSALFIVFLPIELVRLRKRRLLTWPTIREMLASASPFVPTLLAGGVVTAFVTWLFTHASALAPFSVPVTWWSVPFTIVVVDFLYYWDHRAGHRVGIIWAISHSVHHSSPQFNQTTGLRISFVDGFIAPWFYLPAVVAGLHPLVVVASLGVVLGYQQWIHTETIGKLGWFDRVFNSPSNHRVHHGVQPHYLDRNYGGILMLWDRWFGTYEPEREPPRYGLTHPIPSSSPVAVHLAEAVRYARMLRATRTAREALALLLGPPGDVKLPDPRGRPVD